MSSKLEQRNLVYFFLPILVFLGLIWGVHIANFLSGYSLNQWFGLRPRTSSGLPGILLCPLLHADFGHTAFNSAPLALLGGMIIFIDRRSFIPALAMIVLIGGFLTWVFARPATLHVGASGVVYGFFGFLVLFGYFRRSPTAIVGSVAAIVFYWYLLKGVVPSGPGVSWEGHLFGLVGGLFAGFFLGSRTKSRDDQLTAGER